MASLPPRPLVLAFLTALTFGAGASFSFIVPASLEAQRNATALSGYVHVAGFTIADAPVFEPCGHCHEMEHPVEPEEWVHQMTADLPKFVNCSGGGGHMVHDCENGDGIDWAPGTCSEAHGPPQICEEPEPNLEQLLLQFAGLKAPDAAPCSATHGLRLPRVGPVLRTVLDPLGALVTQSN